MAESPNDPNASSSKNGYNSQLIEAVYSKDKQKVIELVHAGVDANYRQKIDYSGWHKSWLLGWGAKDRTAADLANHLAKSPDTKPEEVATFKAINRILVQQGKSQEILSAIETNDAKGKATVQKLSLEAASGRFDINKDTVTYKTHDPVNPSITSPLKRATEVNNTDAISTLIDQGKADVNATTNQGNALTTASKPEVKIETLNLLLKQKDLKVDQPTPDGSTALMFTAANGDVAKTKALLDAKADPTVKNDANKTAKDYAKEGISKAESPEDKTQYTTVINNLKAAEKNGAGNPKEEGKEKANHHRKLHTKHHGEKDNVKKGEDNKIPRANSHDPRAIFDKDGHEIRMAEMVPHSLVQKLAQSFHHFGNGTLGQHETPPLQLTTLQNHQIGSELKKIDGIHTLPGFNKADGVVTSKEMAHALRNHPELAWKLNAAGIDPNKSYEVNESVKAPHSQDKDALASKHHKQMTFS